MRCSWDCRKRSCRRCLNPCCNGIYSMRAASLLSAGQSFVLILVVMEYTQWGIKKSQRFSKKEVLILVVMEYTQWVAEGERNLVFICLNPCCNGIYSMSAITTLTLLSLLVLILVVMEYTQWEGNSSRNVLKSLVLILVVMEYTQWVQKCTH